MSNVCDSNLYVKYMVHNSCANHNGSDSTALMSCKNSVSSNH